MIWTKNESIDKIKIKLKNFHSEFFKINFIVISCPLLLSLSQWFETKKYIFKIKQPFWWKLYCWVNKLEDMTIVIKNLFYQDCIDWEIKTFEYQSLFQRQSNLIERLSKFLNDNWFKKWVEINFFSDKEYWTWLWSISSICFLLSYMMHILVFDISQEFEKIQPIYKNKIIDFWYELESLFRRRKIDYVNIDSITRKISCPLIYLIDKKLANWKNTTIDSFLLNKDLSNYKKWIPMDYCIIFMPKWNFFNQNQILNSYNIKFKQIINDYYWKMWKSIEFNIEKDDSNFMIWESFENILSYFEFKYSMYLNEIYEFWYDDTLINSFLMFLNEFWKMSSMLRNQSYLCWQFDYHFNRLKSSSDELFWFLPTSSGFKWDNYILYTKFNKSRNTIKNLINHINVELNLNIQLQFCSREDSLIVSTPRIEQNLYKNKYSKYIDWEWVNLISNDWVSYIWNYNDIILNEKVWILLDTIEKKIYINWQKVNSKEIPSQTSSVDILCKLLDNVWKDILNTSFCIWSYSKNKNEMLWKIILPMNKLVLKIFWEKLPIKCSWSLRNFYIRLDNTNIKLSKICKIWQ